MENLTEDEVFSYGIAVGIAIHQQKVLTAYESKKPLELGGEVCFIQNGSEILEQMLEEICR